MVDRQRPRDKASKQETRRRSKRLGVTRSSCATDRRRYQRPLRRAQRSESLRRSPLARRLAEPLRLQITMRYADRKVGEVRPCCADGRIGAPYLQRPHAPGHGRGPPPVLWSLPNPRPCAAPLRASLGSLLVQSEAVFPPPWLLALWHVSACLSRHVCSHRAAMHRTAY